MHLIVADSSPLIYLTRLGFFSLLRILHDSVIVPASVWNEVVIGGAGLPESKALQTAVADGWIQVMAPTVNAPAVGARAADLGAGEVQAIQLARELRAVLATDDAEGRELAEHLGVKVTGTVGILIRATKAGHLPELRPTLDRLRRGTNFRMSEQLYFSALKTVGEHTAR